MFSRIIRPRPQLPLRILAHKRCFAYSGFVYSEKEDGENKGNNNSADNKQNNSEANDPNKQNNDVKGDQDKNQGKPQDESIEQQKAEPSLEDQLKECTTKYKTLQVK